MNILIRRKIQDALAMEDAVDAVEVLKDALEQASELIESQEAKLRNMDARLSEAIDVLVEFPDGQDLVHSWGAEMEVQKTIIISGDPRGYIPDDDPDDPEDLEHILEEVEIDLYTDGC